MACGAAMMRLGTRLASQLRRLKIDLAAPVPLEPRLHERIHSALVRSGDCIVFESSVGHVHGAGSLDRTGLEALANELHVEDHVTTTRGLRAFLEQGLRAAMELAGRPELASPSRVVFSRESGKRIASIRFFQLRRDEPPWCSDDPDDYALEDVMILDTEPRRL